ncbi:MAG: hypothetical protein AB7P76_09920 [Candidatus Melainabacteria bacterium]
MQVSFGNNPTLPINNGQPNNAVTPQVHQPQSPQFGIKLPKVLNADKVTFGGCCG